MDNPIETPVSLLASILAQAAKQPDLPALIFWSSDGAQAQMATFGEVVADARRSAWTWRQLDVSPGEVVLLAMSHSYDLVVAFLGALYAGAVPVILPNPRPRQAETDYQRVTTLAEQTRAAAVFTTQAIADLEVSKQVLSAAGCRTHVFSIAQASPAPDGFGLHERSDDAPHHLQLTSGTTGAQKLVVLSQKAVISNISHFYAIRHQAGGSVVGCMPFSHDGGLVLCLLAPLAMGQLSIHINPVDWVARPDLLWLAVTAYQGGLTFLPNFGLNFMVRRISAPDVSHFDLSSLHTIVIGAELVTDSSLKSFYRHFAPCKLSEQVLCSGYGMAEQVVAVTSTPFGFLTKLDWVDRSSIRNGTIAIPAVEAAPNALAVTGCGIPIPGVEVRIADSSYHHLPERHIGEVLLRTPFRFDGYYGRPDLTAHAFIDGWYKSGDLGYQVGEELFILGRKDDLIILGGQNIQPQAVEEIAAAVMGERGRMMVAFSLPDEALGTQAAVLVCEIRNAEPSEQQAVWRAEIMAQMRAQLNAALTDIRFVPKGWVIQADAKVGRAANREKYLAEYQPASPVNPAGDLVGDLSSLAAVILGIPVVQPEDNFFELGGDSLSAIRFLIAVEDRFGRVDAEVFFRRPTVLALTKAITGETDQAGGQADKTSRPSGQRLMNANNRFIRFLQRGPIWRNHKLPYSLGCRLQRAMVALPWVQALYPQQLARVRRWFDELGFSKSELDQAVMISMMSNTWKSWRRHALSAIDVLDPWITITGEKHWWSFESRPSYGTVIAIYHSDPAIDSLKPIFRQTRLEAVDIANPPGGSGPEGSRPWAIQERSAQLWQARQVLLRKGAVLIAADGYQGRRSVDIPFYGGLRNFQIGAAEMAISSGALFIPAFATYDIRGRIHWEVLPPLIPQGTNPTEQIINLTEQYGALFVAYWPQIYNSMNWGFLRK